LIAHLNGISHPHFVADKRVTLRRVRCFHLTPNENHYLFFVGFLAYLNGKANH